MKKTKERLIAELRAEIASLKRRVTFLESRPVPVSIPVFVPAQPLPRPMLPWESPCFPADPTWTVSA